MYKSYQIHQFESAFFLTRSTIINGRFAKHTSPITGVFQNLKMADFKHQIRHLCIIIHQIQNTPSTPRNHHPIPPSCDYFFTKINTTMPGQSIQKKLEKTTKLIYSDSDSELEDDNLIIINIL